MSSANKASLEKGVKLKEPALLVFVLMEARAWMDRPPTVDMDLRASVRRDTME